MSDAILIAYASKHGSTRQVADAIAQALEESGMRTDVRPARAVRDAGEYTAVVLGGPIYMGRWHGDARGFLRRNRKALVRVPFAAFATGPVTDKADDWRGARRQLDKALAGFPELRPVDVRLFGGSIDPTELRFPFSKQPPADRRDWSKIRAWAGGLPELLAPRTKSVVAR